jgi:hypothetical protein
MQKRLQDKYNVTIGYDTIWKGKEKALADMYGTWEQLLNWKTTVIEKSPDNVIELDVHMVGGKMYFRRFFVHLDRVLMVSERVVGLILVSTQRP